MPINTLRSGEGGGGRVKGGATSSLSFFLVRRARTAEKRQRTKNGRAKTGGGPAAAFCGAISQISSFRRLEYRRIMSEVQTLSGKSTAAREVKLPIQSVG